MSADNIAVILTKRCRERKSIRLKQEYLKSWLESQQSSGQTSNTEQLYNALVDDFLNEDIGLTSEAVIPQDFGRTAVTNFPNGAVRRGGVVLQLQDTMDISNSAFSLFNKIKNTAPVRQVYIERSEEDGVDFPRGILRWTLSDGTTQLQALEIETIPSLDLKTPFGCKILVKSCQVRRGMLLLKRESVEVLGGYVPELYRGNMMLELELRLKQKLGLVEQPATPVPEAQPHQKATSHEDTDDMDIFDDDIDYSRLDLLASNNNDMDIDSPVKSSTTTATTTNMTTNESSATIYTQRPTTNSSPTPDLDSMFSDDDDFMPPTTLPRSPAKPMNSPHKVTPSKRKTSFSTSTSTTTASAASATLVQQSPAITPSQADQRKRPHIERKIAAAEETATTLVNTIDRQNSAPKEEDSTDLSWIDPSVWENIDKVKEEKEPAAVEKDGYCSFQTFSENLKAMEDTNFSGNLPDTVTVRALCVKFGRMTMSAAKGFYLEMEFVDPNNRATNPICVIFNNEMITRLVGYTKEEIKVMHDVEGPKKVVKKIFRPFQNQLLNKIAMVKVDLSVLSEASGQSYNKLLPLAIGFDVCN